MLCPTMTIISFSLANKTWVVQSDLIRYEWYYHGLELRFRVRGRDWLGTCQDCFPFLSGHRAGWHSPGYFAAWCNYDLLFGQWNASGNFCILLSDLTHKILPWDPLLSFLPVCWLDFGVKMTLETMCWTWQSLHHPGSWWDKSPFLTSFTLFGFYTLC
jgi:hypothetical protein